MAVDYKKLAADIVEYVGGPENINTVQHCMTRLRFTLKDVKKADKEKLENLKPVMGVVYAGGQYMVILGPNLIDTYTHVVKDFNIHEGQAIDENLDAPAREPWTWKNAGSKIIGFISGAVTPLIPGLIAGGMLKVVLLLIVTFINKGYANTSSYTLLSSIADAPFYFMPIIVAYGAAKKLGGTPVYAMVATASLLHPNFTALVAGGKAMTLFGMGVKPLSYGTSLLPALLIAIVAYWMEKFLNKIVPGIFKSVFVGMGTIFVAGSLGFLVLGPLGNVLGQGIANFFMFLSKTVGPLAVGLLAAALPWMVMAGMHTALAPFMTQLLTNPGYDAMIRPAFLLHNMAEGGSVIGVALRTKDKEFRSECFSLAVGCIVAGVTEPAIYGVNLKYKRPMYGVMAGGFAGGFVASLLGAKAYVMGYSNILALPIFQKTIGAMAIAVVVAIVVSAVVTYVIGYEAKDTAKSNDLTKPVHETYADDEIVAVANGELVNLDQVNDEAFSSRAMGDGAAIKLESDFVCAPANGKITALFPTGHAFGITTKEGVEILVHIGIDTVKLNGKGFDVQVKQDQEVTAGQPVVRVDRKQLEKEGYDLTTMMIVTNPNGKEIKLQDSGSVKIGTVLNK